MELESDVNFLLDHVMVYPVNTISHIPYSACPLLAHVFSTELQKAWGLVRLLVFAKAILYALLVINLITATVMLFVPYFWITFMCGCYQKLKSPWSSLQEDVTDSMPVKPASSSEFNISHALFWDYDGRYSNVFQVLNSVGVVGHCIMMIFTNIYLNTIPLIMF